MSQPARSLAEIAASFDTDKPASKDYLRNYERFFGPQREQPVALLELGVLRGGSLLTWNEYFANGIVVGLDIDPNPLATLPERVRFYQGSQDDRALLSRIATENAPQGFDFIIDDAAHFGALSRVSFETLFTHHLKPGGVFVVEDWGTGYWDKWPDGKPYRGVTSAEGQATDPAFPNHNFGMVGFVKQLIDWLAWPDIARGSKGAAGDCPVSSIQEVVFFPGQVYVVKARAE